MIHRQLKVYQYQDFLSEKNKTFYFNLVSKLKVKDLIGSQ